MKNLLKNIYAQTMIEYCAILTIAVVLPHIFPFISFESIVAGAALIISLHLTNCFMPIKTKKR